MGDGGGAGSWVSAGSAGGEIFWILDSGLLVLEFRSRLPQGLDFGLMDFAFRFVT